MTAYGLLAISIIGAILGAVMTIWAIVEFIAIPDQLQFKEDQTQWKDAQP